MLRYEYNMTTSPVKTTHPQSSHGRRLNNPFICSRRAPKAFGETSPVFEGKPSHSAFSLVEMLVVIAIIAILASLLLPAFAKAKAKALRVECVADLKQIGIGFHVFLHDHDSKLPMEVSTNYGGTLEFTRASYLVPGQFYFQYRHFQALSNDLRNPKNLVCPSDRARLIASDFHDFDNLNISYFVGANADYTFPNSILAGDRNITNASAASSTIVRLADGTSVEWTDELHVNKGNVLYADGRVEELNSTGLAVSAYGSPSKMDLFLPTIKSMAVASSSASSPSASSYYPHYDPPSELPGPSPSPAKNNNNHGGPTQPASYVFPPRSATQARTTLASAGQPPDAVSLLGAPSQKVPKNTPKIDTNVPDEAPITVVLAQTSPLPPRTGNSWPWWLLLLLFLIIAAEIARRRFAQNKDGLKRTRPRN